MKYLLKRGNWIFRVQLPDSKRGIARHHFFLENLATGECDYPMIYEDNTIAYDFPEKLTFTLRSAISKFAENHNLGLWDWERIEKLQK